MEDYFEAIERHRPTLIPIHRQTLSSIIPIFLWIGFAAMSLSALAFLWLKFSRRGQQIFHSLLFLVVTISSLSYLTMALHYTKDWTHPLGILRHVRYIDLLLTTPLILTALLALIKDCALGPIVFVAGTDMLMVAAWWLGSTVFDQTRYYFWGFSVVMFIFVIFGLFRQFAELPRFSERVGSLYKRLFIIVAITWTAFIILWLVGEGTRSMPKDVGVALVTVTDLVAKLGFGFILLLHGSVLDEVQGRGLVDERAPLVSSPATD